MVLLWIATPGTPNLAWPHWKRFVKLCRGGACEHRKLGRVRDVVSVLERPAPPEPGEPRTGKLGVQVEPAAQCAKLRSDQEADLPTPRLAREYLWIRATDGYVDDLLAQVVWTCPNPIPPISSTATQTILFAIRNANHNVVGLTDDEGEPAAWFGYTPYGELDLAQAGSSPQSALAVASRVGR